MFEIALYLSFNSTVVGKVFDMTRRMCFTAEIVKGLVDIDAIIHIATIIDENKRNSLLVQTGCNTLIRILSVRYKKSATQASEVQFVFVRESENVKVSLKRWPTSNIHFTAASLQKPRHF